jgi:hypothetical protein
MLLFSMSLFSFEVKSFHLWYNPPPDVALVTLHRFAMTGGKKGGASLQNRFIRRK